MNEYVAEYPRPPRIELISGSVAIYIQDEIIARDCEYIRVCETYHPPSIYIKPSAFTEGNYVRLQGNDHFVNGKVLQLIGISQDPMETAFDKKLAGVTPIQMIDIHL